MSDSRQQALEHYRRLAGFHARDPQNRALALDCARAALAAGEVAAAQAVIETALEHAPGDHELMFVLGTSLLAQNRFTEAAAQYQALTQAVSHPAIRYNLAYALHGLRDYQGSCEVLDVFGAQDWAAVPDAHLLYARCCHFLGRFTESETHYRSYLAVHADAPLAWGELSLVLFDDDRVDAATEAAERALTLHADVVPALLTLGSIALERQQTAEAHAHLSRAVKLHPVNGRAWSGLAFTQMLALDFDAAATAFAEAVRYMPDHIGTWHGLGWLQILRNDLDGARASFERALALDRNFGETHGGLAVLGVLQGESNDATEKMIRRGVGLNPQSFSARYARSLLLARQGRQADAQAQVDDILDSAHPQGRAAFQQAVAEVVQQAAGMRRSADKNRDGGST